MGVDSEAVEFLIDWINYTDETSRHKRSPVAHEITASNRSGLWPFRESRGWRGLAFAVGAHLALLAFVSLAELNVYSFLHRPERPTDRIVFETIVERIIEVESAG